MKLLHERKRTKQVQFIKMLTFHLKWLRFAIIRKQPLRRLFRKYKNFYLDFIQNSLNRSWFPAMKSNTHLIINVAEANICRNRCGTRPRLNLEPHVYMGPWTKIFLVCRYFHFWGRLRRQILILDSSPKRRTDWENCRLG